MDIDSLPDDKAGLAARLTQARENAGSPSYQRVRDVLRDALGDAAPTPQAINKLHLEGVQPERVDLYVIQFLAELYDVRVSDLSEIAAERIKNMRDLLERSRSCFTGRAGQRQPVPA